MNRSRTAMKDNQVRKLLKKTLLRGLGDDSEPGLWQLCCGFAVRCFWVSLFTTFLVSILYCVLAKWTPETREVAFGGIEQSVARLSGNGMPAVHQMPPLEQLDFWQSEIEKLEASRDLTADELMGAAVLLSQPCYGYLNHWHLDLVMKYGAQSVMAERSRINLEYWSDKCLSFAARSTALSPDNGELWRIRALLLFQRGYSDTVLRDPDWRAVLKEAKTFDSDNALYDYLAASYCWQASTEWDYEAPEGRQRPVTDRQLYAEGHRFFRAGLACEALRLPGQQMECVLALASRLQHPHDASRLAADADPSWTTWRLLRSLTDQLPSNVNEARLDGDPELAVQVAIQQGQVARQMQASRTDRFIGLYQSILESQSHLTLRQMQKVHPELVAAFPGQAREDVLFRQRSEGEISQEVVRRLLNNLGVDMADKDDGTGMATCADTIRNGGLYLAFTLMAFGLARLMVVSDQAVAFGWRHGVAFGVTLGFSVLLYGVIPAGLIEGEIAFGTVIGTGFLLFVAGLSRCLWMWFGRPEGKCPVRIPILIPAIPVFGLFFLSLVFVIADEALQQTHSPATLGPMLANMASPKLPDWARVVFHWEKNDATTKWLVGSFALSAFWMFLRIKKRRRDEPNPSSPIRNYTGNILHCWTVPLLAIGLSLTASGLYSLPAVADKEVQWERYRLVYCSPEKMEALRAPLREQVVNDSALMTTLMAKARATATRGGGYPDEPFYLQNKPTKIDVEEPEDESDGAWGDSP